MLSDQLFVIPKPIAHPKLRLFCFPYAGGGVSTYIPWASSFADDNIELVAVQTPGKGSRIRETPHSNMTALVDELTQHKAYITSVPYIFFGHSLGSRIAFEFTSRLNKLSQKMPLHLFVSGSRAPHLEIPRMNLHTLPTTEFIQQLGQLNGTPKELLAETELMKILLPSLRADFKMFDTYRAAPQQLNVPMTVFGGTLDSDVNDVHLKAWQELVTSKVDVHYVPGDHFFINQNKLRMIEHIKSIISGLSIPTEVAI